MMACDLMLALLLGVMVVVVMIVLMSVGRWGWRVRLKSSVRAACHTGTQGIHPYPGLVHLEQVPNQFAEINSPFGGKVECQLATIPI
jgi:hypothetical protein